MGRYPDEIKLAVIKYCVEGHHSARDAMKEFSIPTTSTIRAWINRYQEHGLSGLHKNYLASYSGEFKMEVLKYMYANKLSYLATANHFNLGSHKIVQGWEQILNEKGPQYFNIEMRGKIKRMRKDKANQKPKNDNREKELLNEIKQLQMENEYLKKLNALVQERIKRENRKK